MTGNLHHKTILSLSSALVGTLLATAPALAQGTPPAGSAAVPSEAQPQTDVPGAGAEIVVTGFRQSLASAINLKRNSSGVVDAIKAEDIAQFPDLNLAESLQRIPGVAITRVQGEGRSISVRGLGSEYTRVRINGMEALTTSSGTANSGGTNRGRGFDFNIFSSDLFNELVVRKSASADVEEGSLGATVDLRTARPFDFTGPRLVASAQASYNDLAEKVTPRLSLLASDRFLDGRLGVLVSAAYEKRRLIEEGANITRWEPAGDNGGFNAASTLPGYTLADLQVRGTEAIFVPRIPSYVSYDVESERIGVTGSVQYEATDQMVIGVDALYSRLNGTRSEAQLQAIGLSRGGTGKPNTIIRDGVVDENNNLVTATFDNVDLRTQTSYDELNTEFLQVTGTIDQDFGNGLKIGFLGGYADSKFGSPVSTTVTFDRVDSDGFTYDFANGRFPALTYGFDLSDPANWSHLDGTSEVRIRPSAVRNRFENAKIFGEYEFVPELVLRAGVDFRRFRYDSTERRRARELTVQTLTSQQVADLSYTFDDFGRGIDLGAGAPSAWLTPDLEKYASAFDIYSNTGIYQTFGVENSSARGNNENVQEKTWGAYAQLDFNLEAGLPLRGNVGVRYFSTRQDGTAFAAVGNVFEQVSIGRRYDMLLPSLNLVADVSPTLVARFAAAQTIARPGLGSVSPGGNVSVQGANRNYSTGNPFLAPTKSNNLDLSLEWYPQSGAIFAIGLFYKDIDTFVQTLRRDAAYNTLGLPLELLAGTGASPDEIFQVTQPVNSDGGPLKGLELNVQQPFTFLPGALANFGIQANYTFVDSSIEYLTSTAPGAPTVDATLVGLSRHAANGTLYYEDTRFSVRGSIAYRSGYLTSVPASNSNDVQGVRGTINVDAQASYNLNDRVQLSIEAVNLTDQYNDGYVDSSNRLNVYTHTGRQFFFGVRYAL
ncbi:TonB-dependent receptor [Croceibacterium ferulae]|uniref:TonB-dependent receptor n=1 Tax=Croceibacterium ferulae TaxID=1854641 RepID=UPI000EAB8D85|nr:TonB-dependent receptor [Croceibacterium ferulae]